MNSPALFHSSRQGLPFAFALLLTFTLFADLCIGGVSLEISTDRESSLYEQGEEVTFSVQAKDGDGKINQGEIYWTLRKGGYSSISQGKGSIKKGNAVEAKGSLDEPGFILLTAVFTGADGKKVTAYGGAGVAPAKLQPSLPAPSDFDEFWNIQKANLAKVPMTFELKPQVLKSELDKGIEAFDVQIQCESNGLPVSGYFSKPKSAAPKSLPAVLWVHGAGVRSSLLSTAIGGARKGYLSMDINAHGIPNGKPKEFYADLNAGELENYSRRNPESRDDVYFRAMFVRLIRAIDFLTSRPEWDGTVMAVMGHSQGGYQALVAGGLDERVTFIGSGVPAGCDHTGMKVNRISGWPKLVPLVDGKPNSAALEASRYVDAVNFASRCEADAIVSAGFIDTTCPPTSIYAAYNVLKGKKEMINKPAMGHAAPTEIKKQFWKALEIHTAARK